MAVPASRPALLYRYRFAVNDMVQRFRRIQKEAQHFLLQALLRRMGKRIRPVFFKDENVAGNIIKDLS